MFISAKIKTSSGVLEVSSLDGAPLTPSSGVLISMPNGDNARFEPESLPFHHDPYHILDKMAASGGINAESLLKDVRASVIQEFNDIPQEMRHDVDRKAIISSLNAIFSMAREPSERLVSTIRAKSGTLYRSLPRETAQEKISEIVMKNAERPSVSKWMGIITEVRSVLMPGISLSAKNTMDIVPDLAEDVFMSEGASVTELLAEPAQIEAPATVVQDDEPQGGWAPSLENDDTQPEAPNVKEEASVEEPEIVEKRAVDPLADDENFLAELDDIDWSVDDGSVPQQPVEADEVVAPIADEAPIAAETARVEGDVDFDLERISQEISELPEEAKEPADVTKDATDRKKAGETKPRAPKTLQDKSIQSLLPDADDHGQRDLFASDHVSSDVEIPDEIEFDDPNW